MRDASHPRGPLTLAIHEGIVDHQTGGANVLDQAGIEGWLVELAKPYVSAKVLQQVQTSIAQKLVLKFPIGRPVTCPTCHAADAPVDNPGMWNVPSVQPYNNCYNYANNQIANTFAQPGRATGHMYTALTCASVQPAAQSDGLVPVANFSSQLAVCHGWYVALVIWPNNNDFRWYRQEALLIKRTSSSR